MLCIGEACLLSLRSNSASPRRPQTLLGRCSTLRHRRRRHVTSYVLGQVGGEKMVARSRAVRAEGQGGERTTACIALDRISLLCGQAARHEHWPAYVTISDGLDSHCCQRLALPLPAVAAPLPALPRCRAVVIIVWLPRTVGQHAERPRFEHVADRRLCGRAGPGLAWQGCWLWLGSYYGKHQAAVH